MEEDIGMFTYQGKIMRIPKPLTSKNNNISLKNILECGESECKKSCNICQKCVYKTLIKCPHSDEIFNKIHRSLAEKKEDMEQCLRLYDLIGLNDSQQLLNTGDILFSILLETIIESREIIREKNEQKKTETNVVVLDKQNMVYEAPKVNNNEDYYTKVNNITSTNVSNDVLNAKTTDSQLSKTSTVDSQYRPAIKTTKNSKNWKQAKKVNTNKQPSRISHNPNKDTLKKTKILETKTNGGHQNITSNETQNIICSGNINGKKWGCNERFLTMSDLKKHWTKSDGKKCLDKFISLRQKNY